MSTFLILHSLSSWPWLTAATSYYRWCSHRFLSSTIATCSVVALALHGLGRHDHVCLKLLVKQWREAAGQGVRPPHQKMSRTSYLTAFSSHLLPGCTSPMLHGRTDNPDYVISKALLLLNRLARFCSFSIIGSAEHLLHPNDLLPAGSHIIEQKAQVNLWLGPDFFVWTLECTPPMSLSTYRLVQAVRRALGVLGALAFREFLAGRGIAQGCLVLLGSLWVPFHQGSLWSYLKIQQYRQQGVKLGILSSCIGLPTHRSPPAGLVNSQSIQQRDGRCQGYISSPFPTSLKKKKAPLPAPKQWPESCYKHLATALVDRSCSAQATDRIMPVTHQWQGLT